MKEIKVAIVDDSALVRQVLKDVLTTDPSIKILFTASDPIIAEEFLKDKKPDVVILDIEMPRMDGITFLKKIMKENPLPVVICSTLVEKGAAVTMEAVSSGAVEIIHKPKVGLRDFFDQSAQRLIQTVKAASVAKIKKFESLRHDLNLSPKLNADVILPAAKTGGASGYHGEKIVALGASTGGTQALEFVLTRLPKNAPAVVVVQHMPEGFTKAFAERLNQLSEIEVKEAADGDQVRAGRAIIARGNYHLLVKRQGSQNVVEVKEGPLVSRHRPSVDVLFRSMSREIGRSGLGILMTGMGDDGAAGLLEMKESGASTIAQDEQSCIVFGMPAEAIKKNAVLKVVSLSRIPDEIVAFANAR